MVKTVKETSSASVMNEDDQLIKEEVRNFPLTRINFILGGISIAVIIIGFLLMLGGSTTEEAFNPDIFSTRRIVVGPTIAFLGFIFMGAAIVYRPRKSTINDINE